MKPKFIMQTTSDGLRYFYLNAANNEVILTSETYDNKTAAIEAIILVIKSAILQTSFLLKTDESGKYYFVVYINWLKAIIATSETYETREAAEKGITDVINCAPAAHIIDRT